MLFQKGDFLLTASPHCVGGGLLYILCTSINVAEYRGNGREKKALASFLGKNDNKITCVPQKPTWLTLTISSEGQAVKLVLVF